MDEKTIARFWSKVNKDGPVPAHLPELGPCWLWVAGTFDTGYGSFWADGKSLLVHRVAWEIRHGHHPGAMMVLHHCDIKPCVRHLFLGTQDDNMADKVRKGRAWHPLGDAHPMRKLTTEDVVAIRLNPSRLGQRELAAQFGVTRDCISQVVRRVRWSHV